jgi:ABC-2 type transport system permease protein
MGWRAGYGSGAFAVTAPLEADNEVMAAKLKPTVPSIPASGRGMFRPGWIGRLRHYFSIYLLLWRNSVVREMSFKSNFLMWIVVEMLWFSLQLVFVDVLYRHTDHIATWTKWEVVMLMGGSHFIQMIFSAFFLSNCVQLSEHIRSGKLDFMLLLPVNTRFLVSLRQVDLGGFVNAGTGLVIMAFAANKLHWTPTWGQALGFLALSAASVTIHYSLMLLISSVSFWTVRAQGIVWGYYNLFSLARLPDEAFRGLFKAFFTFAVPMLLVANVPVKWLLNRLGSPWEMALLWFASLWFLFLSELAWRFALRHYTSASS